MTTGSNYMNSYEVLFNDDEEEFFEEDNDGNEVQVKSEIHRIV